MKNLIIILLIFAVITSMTCSAQAAGRNPKIVSVSGDVKITPAGGTGPVRCKMNMPLKPGDKIKTGRNSYVEVAFDKAKGNIIKVKEKSQVIVVMKGNYKVDLIDGELVTLLKNLKKGNTFQVRAPGAVCGARGTGWIIKTDKKVTDVTVFDGTVFVRGFNRDGTVMKGEYLIEKGFRRRIKRFEAPGKARRIPKANLKKMEKEITLSTKTIETLKKDMKTSESILRERMLEKKVAAISNKLDQKAISRTNRIFDRHMAMSPVRMKAMDMQMQMKMERKADDRRFDRIDDRPTSTSNEQGDEHNKDNL